MSYIVTFLSWVAPALTAWAVQFFTRKMVVVSAVLSTFVFLTAALIVCIKQIFLAVMALAVIPAWLLAALGMFVPSNFAAVLSAIVASKSCRWAYDKATEKLRLVASSS